MCGAFPTGSLLATYMGGYITGGLSPLPAYPTYGGLSLLAPYWLHIWGASFWLHIPHVGGFPYWLPTGCIHGGLHNWGAFPTACTSHMLGAFPTGSLLAAYMGGYIHGGLYRWHASVLVSKPEKSSPGDVYDGVDLRS